MYAAFRIFHKHYQLVMKELKFVEQNDRVFIVLKPWKYTPNSTIKEKYHNKKYLVYTYLPKYNNMPGSNTNVDFNHISKNYPPIQYFIALMTRPMNSVIAIRNISVCIVNMGAPC